MIAIALARIKTAFVIYFISYPANLLKFILCYFSRVQGVFPLSSYDFGDGSNSRLLLFICFRYLQQGTGNREQGLGFKVSLYKGLFPKFVPHLPETGCIIQLSFNR
jgi:hypothetical protein